MALTVEELNGLTHVALPGFVLEVRNKIAKISQLTEPPERVPAIFDLRLAAEGIAKEVACQVGDQELVITIGNKKNPDRDSLRHLLAEELVADGDTLTMRGSVKWLKHPQLETDPREKHAEILTSWAPGIQLRKEIRNDAGELVSPGLRSPQVGALHAIAAHWTVESTPALVVLPTGTGKTEVMLACAIAHQVKRLLVVVPGDLLRTQTRKKFETLGILPLTGILPTGYQRPTVAVLTGDPSSEAERESLRGVHVVVTTAAMLVKLTPAELRDFIARFDTLFFDEAHHLGAASWEAIHAAAGDARIVGFTATPFRLDGTRVPGKIVYQFPLRLAQAQGYFQGLKVLTVDEADPSEADRRIAETAIQCLRDDLAAGLPHILLARSHKKDHAQRLFDEIYSQVAADLSPVLVHSGLRASVRKERLAAIAGGEHKIIVCVDMFGEGYDLPNLKVAAIHSLHQSLAITLQFVGRFTRTGVGQRPATMVLNIADANVGESIEELFAEDADWNQIIPDLSAKAIQGEIDFGEFLRSMTPDGPEPGPFDLSLIRPKMSMVTYRVARFRANLVKPLFKTAAGPQRHRIWTNRDRTLCVAAIHTTSSIDWASVKEVMDETWELYIFYHDRARGLLYVHSSETGSLHGNLVKRLSGDTASIVDGEIIFRAMHGLNRLVFHTLGLVGQGRTRFRMFSGYDLSEVIAPAAQQNSYKSNLFGVGYDQGERESIGTSYKGRVWSMRSATIPEWVDWCKKVAGKITDENIPTDSWFRHTLIPKELNEFPDKELLAVLPPNDWLFASETSVRIAGGALSVDPLAVGFSDWQRVAENVIEFQVSIGEEVSGKFSMSWANGRFAVAQEDGTPLSIVIDEVNGPLGAYFEDFAPVVMLTDGSEVWGRKLLEHPAVFRFQFDHEQVRAHNWGAVPIQHESRWKNGVRRNLSIQGHLIDQLCLEENAFVIDDDDQGESADIVEVQVSEEEHTIRFRLYHCKFSQRANPGVRMKDLHEVVGQAIRSSRLTANPDELFEHLERRETAQYRNHRPTRFEKGNPKDFRKLRRRLRRFQCKFEVFVVQPGLSKQEMTPEASTVLGAADLYIREFTGVPLIVIASP